MHCLKIIFIYYVLHYHVQYCRKIHIYKKVIFPVFKVGTLYVMAVVCGLQVHTCGFR